jgi:sec-independent protein translocase protein TatA
MGDIGAPELLIILVVLLLLFGGTKLPQLARSLGQAKNEFHNALKDGPDEGKEAAPVSVATVVAPSPSDTVTVTPEELQRLVDERARQIAHEAAPPEA